MATGLSVAMANSILNHWRGGAAWVAPAGLFVKLHIGDPGAAGTANPAANTTRQQGTFATAVTTGSLVNSADINWTNLPNTETYSHYSVWDAAAAGAFQWSGQLTAPVAVAAGATATFKIAAGQLTHTFNLAA